MDLIIMKKMVDHLMHFELENPSKFTPKIGRMEPIFGIFNHCACFLAFAHRPSQWSRHLSESCKWTHTSNPLWNGGFQIQLDKNEPRPSAKMHWMCIPWRVFYLSVSKLKNQQQNRWFLEKNTNFDSLIVDGLFPPETYHFRVIILTSFR